MQLRDQDHRGIGDGEAVRIEGVAASCRGAPRRAGRSRYRSEGARPRRKVFVVDQHGHFGSPVVPEVYISTLSEALPGGAARAGRVREERVGERRGGDDRDAMSSA